MPNVRLQKCLARFKLGPGYAYICIDLEKNRFIYMTGLLKDIQFKFEHQYISNYVALHLLCGNTYGSLLFTY